MNNELSEKKRHLLGNVAQKVKSTLTFTKKINTVFSHLDKSGTGVIQGHVLKSLLEHNDGTKNKLVL